MPTKKSESTEKKSVVIPSEVDVTIENKSENPYLIPMAVMVAGLLIAGAIIFKDQAPSSETPNKPVTDVLAATGLTTPEFQTCVAKKEFTDKISAQSTDAEKSGGSGTPYSIVIGPNGKHFVIAGAYPYEEVKKVIDQALAAADPAPTEKEKQDPIYNVKPVTGDDHLRGNPQAPVKVIEFADLQCPYCQIFHGTMTQVMAEYGSKGQVAWVYRHYPLTSIHPHAMPWAIESECANQVGGPSKFWDYVDTRFANQAE